MYGVAIKLSICSLWLAIFYTPRCSNYQAQTTITINFCSQSIIIIISLSLLIYYLVTYNLLIYCLLIYFCSIISCSTTPTTSIDPNMNCHSYQLLTTVDITTNFL